MDEDTSETSSAASYWDKAEPFSKTTYSQTSTESSETPVRFSQLNSVPPQHIFLSPHDDKSSYSKCLCSPIEECDNTFCFNEGCRSPIWSKSYHIRIRNLLDGASTEHHSFVYRQTMSSISETCRVVALEMLRWVIYAARPLHTWELVDAVSFQTGIKLAESEVEKNCGGLLKVTEGGRVCLVHLSLQDYLQSQSMEDDKLGWNAVCDKSHEMIALTCLRLLRPEEFLDCPIVFHFLDQSEQGHTLKIYARQYWKYHYNYAEHQSTYLSGMLHEKLRKSWRKGYRTFGCKFTKAQSSLDLENPHSSNSSAADFVNTALQEGARSGMTKLVKLELEMGASPNASDSLGNTPLHYAALAGNCEVLNLLIDYGGDSNIASKSGETALFHAVANRHFDAVKLLLARGVGSAHSDSLTHHPKIQRTEHSSYQKLYLAVLISKCCPNCGHIRSHYFLSKLPNEEENDETWPPIHVMEHPVSMVKCAYSAMQQNSQSLHYALVSDQRTMVKWFPGISMYNALGVAAQSGMGDVLKLLTLAGNEIEFLERNASLCYFMSNMSVS